MRTSKFKKKLQVDKLRIMEMRLNLLLHCFKVVNFILFRVINGKAEKLFPLYIINNNTKKYIIHVRKSTEYQRQLIHNYEQQIQMIQLQNQRNVFPRLIIISHTPLLSLLLQKSYPSSKKGKTRTYDEQGRRIRIGSSSSFIEPYP